MKTLIVYSSKNGATKECVKYITKQMRHKIDVVDLKESRPSNIDSYDTVILGSSVYAGRLRKEIVTFYKESISKLQNKNLYLLLCCLDGKEKERYLSENLGADARNKFAEVIDCGGIIDMNKLNFAERFLMKIILKKKKDESGNSIQVKNDTVLDTRNYKAMDHLVKVIR